MTTAFWLALNNIEGMGVKTVKRIYQHIPNLSEENLYSYESELTALIKNINIVKKVFDQSYFSSKITDALKSISKHKEKGIEVIHLGSEYYPELLGLIDDPPVILYCKGNIDLLKNHKAIAVVGTRNPTELGYKAAMKIAAQFVKRNFIIVSGLALGIDTAGHVGALKANGSTIAVLAGSLDKIYPKENRDIADDIVYRNGLLVSETPLGGKTFRNSFVLRDRIQSGLSLGVCPVQTGIKGGTQHTIKYAQDQGRLLFCPEPLEPKEVEATQGIYHLLDNELAKRISNEDDYEQIITELENTYKNLLERKQNLEKVDLSINAAKTSKSAKGRQDNIKQISIFDDFNENTREKELLHLELEALISQIEKVRQKLNLNPEDIISKVKKTMEMEIKSNQEK
ncbi:DNA-processing protein DprA [Bacillus sp. REN3]|uniref:DNA-processing protein DprA n=1 Tax=Bacillus sp. REN3 TaxID=2802440 RepID=UPI001AED6F91|nr:DNA-processing protein DprA [Bacillus sp. REN3]